MCAPGMSMAVIAGSSPRTARANRTCSFSPLSAGPWTRSRYVWLSRESLTYRLLVHGPALSGLKEHVRFARAVRGEDPAITAIDIPGAHIREAFRPLGIARRLDQQNPDIREGM